MMYFVFGLVLRCAIGYLVARALLGPGRPPADAPEWMHEYYSQATGKPRPGTQSPKSEAH